VVDRADLLDARRAARVACVQNLDEAAREAQSSASPSAVTWMLFSSSTKVELGKRDATSSAPDVAVMLSRSPLSTSVGTSG